MWQKQIYTGLPKGEENSGNQKKSRKIKKNDKSQLKKGVFLKRQNESENFTKIKKTSHFCSFNLPKSLYSKAFNWKK